MSLRETVLDSLAHRQPANVPYTVAFEGDVAARLDAHYGGPQWRDRILPYITGVGAVDTDKKEVLDATHTRDPYGGIWRTDRLPWHLEKPPLDRPSFDGYRFPRAAAFYRPDWKERARQTIARTPDSFIVGNLGWGLFERCWNLRGFENVLVDALTEQDFLGEALDRLMRLYLDFVEYTADLPIDGILFGDDWGDQRGIMLGPEL
jgi:uroporphyrinogen decarboxylase